ncbi:hypothetical protein P9139_07925 [Curtobacterium flaccumfaciens]|nr:hypothetical protein P9139_07925 [Curtobacterium flaccumfaciens]
MRTGIRPIANASRSTVVAEPAEAVYSCTSSAGSIACGVAAAAVCGVATVTTRQATTAVAVNGTALADDTAEPMVRSGSVIAWVTARPSSVGRLDRGTGRSARRDGSGSLHAVGSASGGRGVETGRRARSPAPRWLRG